MTRKMVSLFEFANSAEVDLFYPINDGVMGGISVGAIVAAENNGAIFQGSVSLEQGGGFASVRAPLKVSDLSTGAGVALRSKGDGKRYSLRLLYSASFDTVAYDSSFLSSSDCWTVTKLPFLSFKPRWRGRTVGNAAALDTKHICALGLMISEKQEGTFKLCIDWIRVYQ